VAAYDPLLGKTLGGRYRIAGIIGSGSMATVYRAEHAGDPPEVALKIMNPAISGDPRFLRRFRREATTSARFSHPNTVRILEYGVDGRHVFIAMELAPGREVAELLVQERRFSERRAAQIMIEVCGALEAAHAAGIVHRDLKPENIMIYQEPRDPTVDRIKVLDFGLAKLLEDAPPVNAKGSELSVTRSAITSLGAVIGTPEYISPEQARSEPVDARSDIYACGVLLYQMVTGHAPFTDGDALEIIVRHVREAPRRPGERIHDLNPRLESIILTALAKQASQRQQSAAELRAALRDVLPELPSMAHPSILPGAGGWGGVVPTSGGALALERTAQAISFAVQVPVESDSGVSAFEPTIQRRITDDIVSGSAITALHQLAGAPRVPDPPSERYPPQRTFTVQDAPTTEMPAPISAREGPVSAPFPVPSPLLAPVAPLAPLAPQAPGRLPSETTAIIIGVVIGLIVFGIVFAIIMVIV
jgi:serine/threonine protein kinase